VGFHYILIKNLIKNINSLNIL